MNARTYLALLSLVVSLPGIAMAQAFPCIHGSACEVTPNAKVLVPVDAKDPLMGKYYGVSSFLRDDDLKGIKLTSEQRDAITSIIENQLPDVFHQIKSLEDAHALLRDMALSGEYDDGLATVLTKTIAESSAKLGLLQAQREYRVYEILTSEQARDIKMTKSGS